MNILLRKARSLLSHAATPSRLGPAVRRNLAVARGRIGGGAFVYDSPLGVRFVCYADNSTSVQLYLRGYQEVAEIEAARAWLRPGDLCCDVGANIGLLTAVFAAAVGVSGTVIAVEPSPRSFARLVDTVDVLGLDQVIPIAACAADTDGATSFYVSRRGAADAEEESIQIDGSRDADFQRAVVPVLRLTTICQALDSKAWPSFVKIDVEGAEPLVCAGAGGMLQAARPPLIVAELHRRALANFDATPADVLRHVSEDAFERFFIPRSVSDATRQRRHGLVYPLTNDSELPIYSNLIAVPRDADEDRRRGVFAALDEHRG